MRIQDSIALLTNYTGDMETGKLAISDRCGHKF